MDFTLSDEHEQVVATIRDFCETEVKPFATAWDADERCLETVAARSPGFPAWP
jgi:alkylation response protein AidB-like acyl-CoA dehydrogenase